MVAWGGGRGLVTLVVLVGEGEGPSCIGWGGGRGLVTLVVLVGEGEGG